tara:strand:+ start:515 stop:811 length:297 start_codon:yes stop_codon:yes gene_type:complete
MSVYLVGAIDIHDPEVYARYQAAAAPILAQMSVVEVLSTDGDPIVFEGDRPAQHMFIIKFESEKDAQTFMESDAYASCIPLRRAASTTHFIMAMRGLN